MPLLSPRPSSHKMTTAHKSSHFYTVEVCFFNSPKVFGEFQFLLLMLNLDGIFPKQKGGQQGVFFLDGIFPQQKGGQQGKSFFKCHFLQQKGDNRGLFSSAVFFSFFIIFSFFRVSFFQLLCTETVEIWLLNGVLRLMRRIIVQILLKFFCKT